MQSNPKRLEYIDGLKGLAILGVMANHWLTQFFSSPLRTYEYKFLHRFFLGGQFGVILFFLVSSFTLYGSSTHRMHTESQPIRNFYRRRFFRIVPLWILAQGVYAWYRSINPLDQWCCFLLLCSFRHPHIHLFNEGWSLIVEESFYLVLPLLFVFGLNARRLIALCLFTLVLRLGWLQALNDFEFLRQKTSAELFPIAHWYVFALGMLLAQWMPKISAYLARLRQTWLALAEGLFFILFVFFGGKASWGSGAVGQTFLLIALFILAAQPKTIVGKICRVRFITAYGTACYSIYLFHILAVQFARNNLTQTFYSLGAFDAPQEYVFLATFPLFALFMLPFGIVSYRYLERPLMRLAHGWKPLSGFVRAASSAPAETH